MNANNGDYVSTFRTDLELKGNVSKVTTVAYDCSFENETGTDEITDIELYDPESKSIQEFDGSGRLIKSETYYVS